jgi:hypothetical protein
VSVRIPALKDSDGDYWIKYGLTGGDMVCLCLGRTPAPACIDGTGPMSVDVLAASELLPLTAVYLDITEVAVPDISKVCDDCLYDRHHCDLCRDAVSHGHTHD